MRAFNPQSIPKPRLMGVDLSHLRGPLALEIGAGQGLHAIRYCLENRGRTLIAVERTRLRHKRLQSRSIAHPELSNLIAVRADAVPFVVHYVADRSLDQVFLFYPNPAPKPAQANQRWHRGSFMAYLKTKMKTGATLQLATNLRWYAEEAQQWMCDIHGFKLRAKHELPAGFTGRTHFERKYLARGETCFDLIFENGLQ